MEISVDSETVVTSVVSEKVPVDLVEKSQMLEVIWEEIWEEIW